MSPTATPPSATNGTPNTEEMSPPIEETSKKPKPVTFLLDHEIARRLRLVSALKDETMSQVLEGYLAKPLEKDLTRLLGKLKLDPKI